VSRHKHAGSSTGKDLYRLARANENESEGDACEGIERKIKKQAYGRCTRVMVNQEKSTDKEKCSSVGKPHITIHPAPPDPFALVLRDTLAAS